MQIMRHLAIAAPRTPFMWFPYLTGVATYIHLDCLSAIPGERPSSQNVEGFLSVVARKPSRWFHSQCIFFNYMYMNVNENF